MSVGIPKKFPEILSGFSLNRDQILSVKAEDNHVTTRFVNGEEHKIMPATGQHVADLFRAVLDRLNGA